MEIAVTLIYKCTGDEKTCIEILESEFGTDDRAITIKGAGIEGSFDLMPVPKKTIVKVIQN
jgi:hypothetical protein